MPLATPPTVCQGPFAYKGQALLERDLTTFKAALRGVSVAEAFVPAIAPAMVGRGQNRYYRTEEEYVFAIAEALRTEYRAIVDTGFILQIDDPGLGETWDILIPAPPLEEYRKTQARNLKAQAYSIEAATPRHSWEWRVWEDVKLPEGQDPHPRRHRAHHGGGRAPRNRRRASHDLRAAGRPRARDGRRRLRLCPGRALPAPAPEHHVGEVRGARGGRATGVGAAMALSQPHRRAGPSRPCHQPRCLGVYALLRQYERHLQEREE
jgi:hypothetical protein